ncbi:hypothetical protein GQF03_16205 [Sneathiella chungangensis]|uniref:Uncharacterized protein n=1 Tax=Sneathiella chungangensis TaxID=1418234 RepID=A0A845MKJ3_9PROT|nr:hypothetical protein [Sneathiella chungangensis]MZR23880.1 hypothetical protein [Sneathiella chungangensis]
MSRHFNAYLGWRPVGSVPIGNIPVKNRATELSKQEIKEEFEKCNCEGLLERDTSIRVGFQQKLDGLFTIVIFSDLEIKSSIADRIAKHISDFVKENKLGHNHDFHGLRPKSFFAQPDREFLESQPVKIRVPADYIVRNLSLKSLLEKLVENIGNLEWDSKKHRGDNAVLAILKIRQQQMKKRKTCFEMIGDFNVNRASRNYAKTIFIIFILIVLYIVPASLFIVTLTNLPESNQKTANFIYNNIWPLLGLLSAAGFLILAAMNYLNIYMVRIPILKILRDTQGYFVYTNVYNFVLQDCYVSEKGIHDYSAPIEAIKVRIDGESQAMISQRDIGRLMLVLGGLIFSVTTYLTKNSLLT